jgi:hypothetical protein
MKLLTVKDLNRSRHVVKDQVNYKVYYQLEHMVGNNAKSTVYEKVFREGLNEIMHLTYEHIKRKLFITYEYVTRR